MSMCGLLQENAAPTDDEIIHAMSGNLCRCGAYQNIVRAGRIAADLLHTHKEDTHAHSAR